MLILLFLIDSHNQYVSILSNIIFIESQRIFKITNNLELSENTKRESIKIFDRLKKCDLVSGKNPEGVTSAVIYMESILTSENISQKNI